MRALGLAGAIVACLGSGSAAAQTVGLDIERRTCRQEGLIASGVFVQSVVAGPTGGLPAERATTDFILKCEDSEVVLSRTDGGRPVEHWRVIEIATDSLFSDKRLRIVFSRVGGLNMVASLNLSNLKGIRAEGAFPVVFLLDLTHAMRQYFGRLSFVAPAYRQDIPLPGSPSLNE